MTRKLITQGLAPASSLAPSAGLAPSTTTYSGGPITPQRLAMGIGANGAMVDVTSYVEFGEGVGYSYGRSNQFDDVSPGTFTFTLDNRDGRFTPENPASPLATKVAEGVPVCWQLGTRLTRGAILSVEIPANDDAWDQLTVTCDDMLGVAGRHGLSTLADGLIEHQGADLLWRLDEEQAGDDGIEIGAEAHQDPLGPFTVRASNSSTSTDVVTMGVAQADGLPGTAVIITSAPGETNWFGTKYGNALPVSNSTNPAATPGQNLYTGAWNFWVYPGSTATLIVFPAFGTGPAYAYPFQMAVTPTTVAAVGGTGAVVTFPLTAAQQGTQPRYYSMSTLLVWQSASSTWALFLYIYIDGVYLGSTPWYDPVHGYAVPGGAGSMSPLSVGVAVPNPSGSGRNVSGAVQRISHTTRGTGLEQNARYDILNERRAVLDFIADELSSATYNGPLSAAKIGYPDVSGSSILDVYNDIARTEAGHLFTRTTGTLLNPVEQIQIRAHDRPETPKVTFHVTDEGEGVPTFIRDITNVARSVEVTGPSAKVTVVDDSITGRYVQSGKSETILYVDEFDLQLWGQDRVYRGKNRAVRMSTFTIDAMTTPTDRTADLLNLVPGDRIRITGTPANRLGFSFWDGYLIGASETHNPSQHRFQLTLAPALPPAAVFDTDRFASDGDATLAAAAASNVGTVYITTGSGAGMSTDCPYTIQIDREQMTVLSVTGTAITVGRGANGTTAAAHPAGAAVEVVPTALFAY